MIESRSAGARWRALPPWLRIGALYLAARAVTTGFFLIAAAMSGVGSRFGENATIADFAVGWDAQWYWLTAVSGYPLELPLTDSGQVAENQWAFMPIYAYLAAALGTVLGSWIAGAVVISLSAGYLSALVLYRLWLPRVGESAAMWAVLFFVSGPLAALFHVGYAESLFMLWLFLALLLVARRRYGWLYLVIPLMGFTRPGVLAFALFLGLFGIWRWTRRRSEALSGREISHIVALGALGVIVGFGWQVIAAVATGDAGAYLATELAWRRNWLTGDASGFIPFEGFIQGAEFWFVSWGSSALIGVIALSIAVVGVSALLLFHPAARRVGVEIRWWAASYLLYLLAVFFPQSSIFRLLVPLSPLWGAVAVPKRTAWRVGVVVVALVGQWWWIYNMYALGNTYWQIP
nr:hypothetical protein [Microbacterium halimionae]